MSTFTEVEVPDSISHSVLKGSWRTTVEECNKVLRRLSKHKLSKIKGWIPYKLERGSHNGRVNALLAVNCHEINAVRELALRTDSFRRLPRHDQELLTTKATPKLNPNRLRKLVELLREVQQSEIQAEQKLEKDRREPSSSQRRREAKKLERKTADRRHTFQTKGPKVAGPKRLRRC